MDVDRVFVLCCVGSGLSDELIIRSDEPKCLNVCDLQTSAMKRPRPELGCCTTEKEMCVVLFQMKPTRCTLLLSIFISTSLHVSGNYVPIIRRNYCICAALVFFTLYGWLSGLQTRHCTFKSPIIQYVETTINIVHSNNC